MTKNCDIGELGLECLMSRANIIFTNGYQFHGQLDIDNLQQSFINVVDGIHKFKHRLDFTSQNQFQWQQLTGPFKNRFLVVESEDINQEFKNICGRSFDIIANSGHYPMALVLIVEKNKKEADSGDEKNFIIAQLSEHTYVDAGSSEVIFNQVIDYYNALTNHDIEKTQSILKVIKKLKTINTQAMVDLLKQEHFDHQQNIEKLTTYPIADVGEHKIPLDAIPGHLEKYKTRVRKPIIQFFDIKNLLKQCRELHPEISRNSATCAAICKAIYNLNVAIKGADQEHIISFKMLSNLLPEKMRQVYSGNYIAFVPVTVNGDDKLEDIAYVIDNRVKEFKQTQLNLSIYSLVEDAVQAEAVGQADEEISFIVTNWNNYRFIKQSDYLTSCRSIAHISGVNIEPKDTLGGVLVNRPVIAISLSPDERLCLSYFPSLRSDEDTKQIAEQMDKVFSRY